MNFDETRALLAAIVDSSEDGIASKNLHGIVTSWNKSAERLFGYDAEEMIGRSILTIIPPELHQQEDTILAKLRNGERIERFETTRLHKDGRRLTVSLTISPVRDATGRIIGAAKIAHDVTALRERERQLKELNESRELLLESERSARQAAERLSHAKDEFLATLSHELRTPLHAIQGWAMLLKRPGIGSDDIKNGMEVIERNVRAQTQIVNDLLDMSRIVGGQFLIEVRPTNLKEVIEIALDSVRPTAEAKGIRLQALLDSRAGPVRGDPTRLQQVVWNLLTNAIKFTPKGGRVQVSLERVNSHLEIEVADSGIGIDAEFLPFVFDRFSQADLGIARRFGGLGIGLSLVKSLVELHGGSVRVKSPGKDQGSTFIVALPVQVLSEDLRPGHLSAADPLETIQLPRLDGVRLLIVDDDADGRALIMRIAADRGAVSRVAASAPEALEILSRERYDILLSDVGMPGMDGYQFIQRVRDMERGRQAPVPAIAITAYARPEDRQRALLAGYQLHLTKPLEAPELIAAIASLKAFSRG